MKERTIIVIRHAQCEHLLTDLTGGWTDDDLTDTGRNQANQLADWLYKQYGKYDPSIYSSSLKRAKQTAEPIAEIFDTDPTEMEGLKEFNNGMAANKTESKARQYAIERTEPLLEWHPYAGSESWRQFYKRVCDAMDVIYKKDETLQIVVSHGASIMNIVVWWLLIDVEVLKKASFNISPASVTILKLNDSKEHVLDRLNCTSHLRQ